MKINIISLISIILSLFNLTFSLRNTNTLSLNNQLSTTLSSKNQIKSLLNTSTNNFLAIESTFRSTSLTSKDTLKNPLRLFKLNLESKILARLKFFWVLKSDPNPLNELNMLNYKVFDITKENMLIYKIDQSRTDLNHDTLNTTNYLMTVKISNIDLPCNGNMFVCTVSEFKKEYKKKLRGVDFSIPKEITKEFGETKAHDHCIIISVGPFRTFRDVGFICMDTKEDAIFYQSFISEKILENSRDLYNGQLLMVNQESQDTTCTKGLQSGILEIGTDEMNFTNGKAKHEKDYKNYIKIPFKDIFGFGSTLYGKEVLPWKLDIQDKPNEFRCFKITAKISDEKTPIYFCVFYEKEDWERKSRLNTSEAMYTNDIWVSSLNRKILAYKLALSQDKVERTESDLDCNAHIMEPIKIEYRNRHKIKQLISIGKVDNQQGVTMLGIFKKKAEQAACATSLLCMETLEVCVKKGFLSLEYGGYKIAYSLQNPYFEEVPKLGVSLRVYPRNSIGLLLLKEAETLTGLKTHSGSIVVDTANFNTDKMLSSSTSLKRSGNTFNTLFHEKGKITTTTKALEIITKPRSLDERLQLRYVDILSKTGDLDPFLELFSFIRGKILRDKFAK